jgi:iron complex transport system substrate-binding protein
MTTMHKRSERVLLAVFAVPALLCAACGSSPAASGASSPSSSSFPVSITAANGTVHIASRPHAIVSLSATATEMLYAIGAGSQVKAVDKNSDYPPGTPRTSLDGFQPNVEAIVSYRPDLVVIDNESPPTLSGQLQSVGIPALELPAATTLEDAYRQYAELGEATGHRAQAAAEETRVKSQIARIVHSTPRASAGQTYYYELDPMYDSATSSTFIGQVLGLLGVHNIADAAPGAASSGGYPQLSAEFIVQSNPDYVFLADTICCGQNARTVGARPGWSTMTAVQKGQVVGLNDDIASRWGPRIVTLLRTVEQALAAHSHPARAPT